MKWLTKLMVEIFCLILDFKSDFQTRVLEGKPLKSWRVVKKEMEKKPKRAEIVHVPGET